MAKVLLMGEPMVMFVAEEAVPLAEAERYRRFLAGAEVNVAIGLSRLGHEPCYVTKLGEDPFGEYIKNCLARDRIGTDYLRFDGRYPTGFQVKGKVLAGDPPVAFFRKNSAASHMGIEEVDGIDFSLFQQVHVTGVLPAISKSCREAAFRLVKKAKEAGLFVSFDPNLRPVLWESKEVMVDTLNRLASLCDMILPGEGEGEVLAGSRVPEEIAAFYHRLGVQYVVIKLGAEGAYASFPEGSVYVPGFKVEQVVDTVGAGDAFAVGVLSGRLEGLSLKEAVRRGNAIGSMQVMVPGDNDGLPSREELQAFFQTRGC